MLYVFPLLCYAALRCASFYFAFFYRTISFTPHCSVKVYVNKLTSLQSLFPLSPYHVPLCRPTTGVKGTRQNLGQHLTGDEIRSSPYQLVFGHDVQCQHLCVAHLGHEDDMDQSDNHMVSAIRQGHHQNWLLDGLPAAFRSENDEYILTQYAGGFPLGFVDKHDGEAYVYNHINLEIEYHPVHANDGDDEELQAIDQHEQYRIVRFTVQPFSVRHKFRDWKDDEVMDESHDEENQQLVHMTHPIPSCQPHAAAHTLYGDIHSAQPQPAEGKVLFTYDVIWKPNMQVHWGDRWEIYLSADG